MFLNQKGQAYSTFKLLIAAIVALAMLMILLPIISSVLGILQNDPVDKTRELLNNLYNKPEATKSTDDVTFTKDYVLSSAAITQNIPLSAKAVCLSLGDYSDDPEYFDPETVGDGSDAHQVIRWTGSDKKVVKITVTCNIDKEKLLTGAANLISGGDITWDVESDCDICGVSGRCCLVALRTP